VGGKPQRCGVDEVFTGTLLGNINYPNDQLTVTRGAGPAVTTYWDSMFSNPPSRFQDTSSSCSPSHDVNTSPPDCSHSAQNIVLSFHCDEPTSMVAGLLQSILGPAGLTQAQQDQINGIVNQVNQQCSPSQKAAANTNKPAAMPTLTGPSATEMAWLSGYTT
jgi:hypothetical protein